MGTGTAGAPQEPPPQPLLSWARCARCQHRAGGVLATLFCLALLGHLVPVSPDAIPSTPCRTEPPNPYGSRHGDPPPVGSLLPFPAPHRGADARPVPTPVIPTPPPHTHAAGPPGAEQGEGQQITHLRRRDLILLPRGRIKSAGPQPPRTAPIGHAAAGGGGPAEQRWPLGTSTPA